MLVADGPTRIQRAILKEYLTTGNTFARLFDLAVVLVFWPWRSTLSAWRLTRSVGRQITDVRLLSVQFFQQIGLAWFHGISPTMYYQMGIATSQSRHRPISWLQDGHAGLLSRVFRADKRLIEINDKALFGRIMASAGIPYPKTEALDSGESNADKVRQLLSENNELFLKPRIGDRGQDAFALVKSTNEGWSILSCVPPPDSSAPVVDEETLIAHIQSKSAEGGWLAQQRLQNAPLLADIFGTGVVSVRIVSGRSTRRFSILGVFVFFPAAGQLVSQRGLNAGVDRCSGIMGKVFSYGVSQATYSRNPYTGKQVEGVRLPHWEECLSMVKKAHDYMPSFPFIGWDIAICPTGPMMLEANGNFAVAGLQRALCRPLIDCEFLAIFNDWRQQHRSVQT